MIGALIRESSLFYVAFGDQASLIKDDLLEVLDAQLDDDDLVELVRSRLALRHSLSSKAGRHGIAPDRLLRCCVLKHVKGWSFRELERELRAGLAYRRFTRFDEDSTPDFSTFSRLFALLGPETTAAIHSVIVNQARTAKVARGRKLRTDTTVVETNVHYPTDSSLLGDGIRVLTRGLRRIADECDARAVKVVDHSRAVKYRLLEISRAAKCLTEDGQNRLKTGYTKLLDVGRRVLRQAVSVAERLVRRGRNRLRVIGEPLRVLAAQATLERFAPLLQRVIAQTEQRVFGGDRHVSGKVLSLFEPYTAVVRRGKAHKPAEFGQLVRIDEVENGIVSNYAVVTNPNDTEHWRPAISQHIAQYGSAPRLATADRGFFSAKNERDAYADRVVKVALPAKGRLSGTRAALQRQRWFRRAMRWRAGIESRISTLKNVFDMRRSRYKGEQGFERHVGWSVIANNLVSLARELVRRKRKNRGRHNS